MISKMSEEIKPKSMRRRESCESSEKERDNWNEKLEISCESSAIAQSSSTNTMSTDTTIRNSPLSSLEIFTNNSLISNYSQTLQSYSSSENGVHSGRSVSASSDSNSSIASNASVSPGCGLSPASPTNNLENTDNCDSSAFKRLRPAANVDGYHERFLLSTTGTAEAPPPRKVPCIVLSGAKSPARSPFNQDDLQSDYCGSHNVILNFSKSKDRDESRSQSPCSRRSNSPSHQFTITNQPNITVGKKSTLTFGIDRILSQDSNNNCSETFEDHNLPKPPQISPHVETSLSPTANRLIKSHHYAHFPMSFASPGTANGTADCAECLLLAKYGYKISNRGPASGPNYAPSGNYGSFLPASAVLSGSSLAWFHQQQHLSSNQVATQQRLGTASFFDNSPLLNQSNGFGHSNLPSSYGLSSTSYSSMSSMVSCNTNGSGRRKRSWSRAVFSNLQRKGLEKRFQMQKYITKPDRRQLAAMLGLTDAQVKVWFQNRRMKWRHTKEGKSGASTIPASVSTSSSGGTSSNNTKDKQVTKH